MPYPNEHSCRLASPDQFERFARKNGEQEHDGKPIDIIYGIKDNKSSIQALRYDKKKWSADAARSHCQSRNGSFEVASEIKEGKWVTKASEVNIEDLIVLSDKPVMLFPFGKWKTQKYGLLDLSKEFAEKILENFKNKVLGTEPFFDDGGHNEDKASGWIKNLFIKGNALFADVEWTSLGKELLADKIYRYPSVHIDKHKNPVDGKEYYPVLKNVTLTNIPVMRMLPSIELCEAVQRGYLEMNLSELEIGGISAPGNQEGAEIQEESMQKELCEILGIDEKADVLEAVKALKSAREKESQEKVTLTEQATKASEEVKTAKAEADSLKVKMAERDANDAVSKAINEGKVAPVQKDWATKYALSDPSGFAEFVKNAPKVIELGERGAPGDESVELTEAERKIAARMGIPEKTLMEHKRSQK